MKIPVYLFCMMLLMGMLCFNSDAAWEWKADTQQNEAKKTLSECRHFPEIVGEFDDVCIRCHVGSNLALKEVYPTAHLQAPVDVKVEIINGELKLSTLLKDIQSRQIEYLMDYARLHNVKDITVEIHSPGGSLFDAWRIVGLFQEWEANGGTITTRAYGFAASAGFLVMASGTIGQRYVSSTAELMWHELLSFEMFKLSTPSSTEEESRILRHLQDTSNQWLSQRCNMTKEEIDEAIRKKEFWINGAQCVERGFADYTI